MSDFVADSRNNLLNGYYYFVCSLLIEQRCAFVVLDDFVLCAAFFDKSSTVEKCMIRF